MCTCNRACDAPQRFREGSDRDARVPWRRQGDSLGLRCERAESWKAACCSCWSQLSGDRMDLPSGEAADAQSTLCCKDQAESLLCLFVIVRHTVRVAYNLPGPPTPVAVTLIGATIELLVLLCALLAKRVATRRQAHESAEHTPQPQRSWLGMPASVAAGLEVG